MTIVNILEPLYIRRIQIKFTYNILLLSLKWVLRRNNNVCGGQQYLRAFENPQDYLLWLHTSLIKSYYPAWDTIL